ncbi:MAG: tetratricopeptide (TPR) repeat protein, partial [Planctomycetota bacterium]
MWARNRTGSKQAESRRRAVVTLTPMKRSVLIPTALALVVVTITIRGIFQTTPRSPVEILNGVQAMINAGEYDERIALRELDRVQSMAIQMGEKRIELQALSLRAEVLRELGSLEDARITLQSLLEAMPGNQRIELRLARLLSLQAKDEDALDSVRELLSADSTHAEAWLLGGILQRERAKKSHDEATQIARQSLVLEQFSGVRKWIDELCSRDPADPERPASSAKLANVLRTRNEIAFERVADLADRASEDNRAARSCFARSFDGLADPRAAEGLIDMWTATGHAVIACEFGMVSTRLAELGTNPGVARALLEALNKADRGMDLASFMARWDWDTGGGDFDFYLSACRSLYDLKAWRSLIRAADLLSKYGSNRGNDYATFFQGMALAGNERHENAIKKLETFIRSESDEPVLEARAASWMAIAKSARVLEMHRDEREALEGYDASGSPMPGEALLRLVELQIAGPHAASRIPEERWTRAMSLLPKRTEELFSEWLRLGEISASQDSRDVDEIVARLKSRRQALPTTDVGPYTLYMVGRAHLEDRRASSAVKVADKLLENYPGLLPAMDLAIEGQLNRGNLLDASHRVLERLEAVGRDSKTVEYLGQLGTQRFTPAQTLLSMRADPSRTGRLAVARFLIEEGEAERALRAIDGIRIGRKAAPEGTVEERVVAGQALLELGRHEEAAERVVGLAADPVFGVSALTVEFEAVLASGDERAMGRLIERTLAIGILSRDLYLAMIDRMLETGFGDLSRPLVEALDAQAETRGGDLFLRQALLGAVTGNREETIEGLSRAEAYLEDGTPELGRLLLAVDDHSWRLLPERVAELRAADFVATPFEEAVLAIFEERIEAGQTLAETQLDAEPERAEWALVLAAAQLLQNQDVVLPPDYGERAAIETIRLLRGSQDSVRDPRLVLGLLVALERQGWSKWAIPRLVELRTTGGAGLVWPSFLAARAHLAMGEEESANRILTALVGRAPRFEPGWDALIQMTEDEYGDPYHSRVVRLKKQRLEALAEEVRGDAMSVAIDQAASRALSGERQGAIKDLEQALAQAEAEAIDLEDAEPIVAGRDLLARLLREEGELLRAASEYGRACDALPNRSDHALVAEFTLMLNGMTRRSFETFPLSSEG